MSKVVVLVCHCVNKARMIRHIYAYTNGTLPIVGVGGIMNADDAWEKITAGATLIQAYAGFVFEGPGLTKAIVHGLHNDEIIRLLIDYRSHRFGEQIISKSRC